MDHVYLNLPCGNQGVVGLSVRPTTSTSQTPTKTRPRSYTPGLMSDYVIGMYPVRVDTAQCEGRHRQCRRVVTRTASPFVFLPETMRDTKHETASPP